MSFFSNRDVPTDDSTKRYLFRAALFGAALFLLWGLLQFSPSSPPSPEDASSASSSATDAPALNTASGPELFSWGNLAALLLLAGGGALAFYLHRHSQNGESSASYLQVIEKRSIGQHGQLHLVTCGDDVLLLGVTSKDITLLKSYTRDELDPHEASPDDALPTQLEASPEGSSTFAELLRRTTGHPTHA